MFDYKKRYGNRFDFKGFKKRHENSLKELESGECELKHDGHAITAKEIQEHKANGEEIHYTLAYGGRDFFKDE